MPQKWKCTCNTAVPIAQTFCGHCGKRWDQVSKQKVPKSAKDPKLRTAETVVQSSVDFQLPSVGLAFASSSVQPSSQIGVQAVGTHQPVVQKSFKTLMHQRANRYGKVEARINKIKDALAEVAVTWPAFLKKNQEMVQQKYQAYVQFHTTAHQELTQLTNELQSLLTDQLVFSPSVAQVSGTPGQPEYYAQPVPCPIPGFGNPPMNGEHGHHHGTHAQQGMDVDQQGHIAGLDFQIPNIHDMSNLADQPWVPGTGFDASSPNAATCHDHASPTCSFTCHACTYHACTEPTECSGTSRSYECTECPSNATTNVMPEARFPATRKLARSSGDVSQSIAQASTDAASNRISCSSFVRGAHDRGPQRPKDCARSSPRDAEAAYTSGWNGWAGPYAPTTCTTVGLCTTAGELSAEVAKLATTSPSSFTSSTSAQSSHSSSWPNCTSYEPSATCVCRQHVHPQLTSQAKPNHDCRVTRCQAARNLSHVPSWTATAKDCQKHRWLRAPTIGNQHRPRMPRHTRARIRIAYASANRDRIRRRGFFRVRSTSSNPRVAQALGHASEESDSVYSPAKLLYDASAQPSPVFLPIPALPSVCSGSQDTDSRRIILLEPLLHWTPQENALLESHMLFEHLSNPWPLNATFGTLDFIEWLPDLPPAARYVFQQVQTWKDDPVHAVHIYVDGSSFGKSGHVQDALAAGWAFTVVVECLTSTSDRFQFYCAACNPLMSNNECSHHAYDVGELMQDSLTSEAVAMIWTLSWVSQMPFQVPAYIYFDNMTIGLFASGQASWTPSWGYEKLHTAISSLRQCLQTKGQPLHFVHQKSHCQHPWSDLVDAVAKAAAKRILTSLQLPKQVPQVVNHAAFRFASLALLPSQTVPLPAAMPGTLKAEGPFGSTNLDVTWNHDPGVEQQIDVTVTLSFTSANVLTLSTGPKNRQLCGLLEQGRIASLQAQFSEQRCSLVGLQECRTFGQHMRNSSSHWVLQSGASPDGSRGCELWVDRNIPYAASKTEKFFFQHNHFHVADFSDRHLMVVTRAPHLQLRLLVIHAPHEHAPDADFESWWKNLSKIVNDVQPQLPLIIMGDTNGRLGSECSDAVSDLDRESENSTGHCLHSFLLEHQLFAPSTFGEFHSGTTVTWVASNGQPHRLDYVFLPLSWKSFDVHSTACNVDLIISKEDHFPVSVLVTMQVRNSSHRSASRVQLDRARLQDPDAVSKFQNYLKQPPTIPWQLGVGEHVDQITQWLQKGASNCFPKKKAQPRQRYMSEFTWQWVQLRKQLLKIAQQTFAHARLTTLRFWFFKWNCCVQSRAGGPGLLPPNAFQILCRRFNGFAHWTLHQRAKFHSVAHQSSKQDRIRCANALVEGFYAAAKGHDTKAIYRALRPLLGQTDRKTMSLFRPLPAVRLQDGTMAPTHEAAQTRWREHFAISEQGIAVTCPQLQELAQLQRRRYPLGAFELDITSIPTLSEVEQYLRKAKRHKSPGSDGLFAEIYQIDVPTVSRLLWPLLAKCTLRCTEPLQWKGGEVFSLPKISSASFNVEHYRSILLADFSSKVRHGLLRRKLLPAFMDFRTPLQAGGIPRLSPDFLTLHVQSFAAACRTKSLSFALFFVDIKQAFYRAFRPLISSRHVTEQHIVQIFQINGWSPEFFQAFRSRLQEEDALSQAGVSAHLQAQVNDLLTSTWFQLRGNGATLTQTNAGTRPGDSVADLLFAFLMTRFIHVIRSRFVDAGLHTAFELRWIPACIFDAHEVEEQHVVQACWVDDLVLMLSSASPSVLLQKLQCAAQILQDTSVEFALPLNYNKDKTSAVVSLHGPSARETWTTLLTQHGSQTTLDFQCGSVSAPLALHIVPDYVYLGTLVDSTAHPASEVRRRFLAVQPMKRMLQKRIFRSPQLPFKTRLLLFQSLVISRLMYGAGAWQAMNVLTLRSFCTQMVQLLHFLVPHLKPQEGVSRLDFVTNSHQPHPMLLLAKYRMSLFDRIAQADMGEMFATLQQQDPTRSWLHLVQQDLACMQHIVPNDTVAAALNPDEPHLLANLSFRHPMILSQYAKTVIKRFSMYSQLWIVFRHFQKCFAHDCQQAGATWQYQVPVANPTEGYACEQCPAVFDSFKALCSHVAKQHQQLSIAQYYAGSNRCRACLKTYDRRTQVLHHLKYMKTNCLVKLICVYDPMTDDELEAAQAEDRALQPKGRNQQRQQRHVWPMLQAPGPILPWPWERHAQLLQADTRPAPIVDQDLTKWIAQVFQAIPQDIHAVYAILCTRAYHGSLAAALTHMFSAHTVDWPKHVAAEHHLVLQEAVCLWQSTDLAPVFNPCLPVPAQVATISLHQVRVPSQPSPGTKPALHQQRDAHVQELWTEFSIPAQFLHQLTQEHAKVYVFHAMPRVQLKAAPICLYIFSGRRRIGDFQFHFEQHSSQAAVHSQVLLIDLALSDDHDVGQQSLVETLLRWIRSGCVCAILLAPPCETWSQARYRISGPHDPRPVRSAEHPFALPALSPKELTQVGVANMLLMVAIRLLLAAMLYGVPAVMEHPAEPKRADRPSIWRLPWIKAMQRFGQLRRCHILQAAYGGVSVKPTHLAYCHMAHF